MRSVHTLAQRAGLGCTVGLLAIFANGCGDSDSPPPQAAFEATFYGGSCAATVSPGPTINIGVAKQDQSSTVADGTDGVHVSCRATPQGDGFYANVRISKLSYSLNFEATMPTDPNQSAPAKYISISGPNTSGAPYRPLEGTNCSATFIQGAAGSIKASFKCDSMWNGIGQDTQTCAVEGVVVAENCEQ